MSPWKSLGCADLSSCGIKGDKAKIECMRRLPRLPRRKAVTP